MEEDNIRVGVFVCECGMNIAGTVDCEAVKESAAKIPGVVVSVKNKYTCADPGQEEIKRLIREHNLNRIVVASCSPRMHESTFRNCISQAGLNPYLLEMANIREHCSWVHLHEKAAATQKANDIVGIAVAKAKLLQPVEEIKIPVTDAALVIGGGVAGIQAALDLADSGHKVYLVEKQPSIGGIMAQLDKTFPTMDCSICVLGPKMMDAGKHPQHRADGLQRGESSVSGYIGNFKVTVSKKARYRGREGMQLLRRVRRGLPGDRAGRVPAGLRLAQGSLHTLPAGCSVFLHHRYEELPGQQPRALQ